jgi:hypothetical protein
VKPLHIDKPKTGHCPDNGRENKDKAGEDYFLRLNQYAAQIKGAKKARNKLRHRKGDAF